MKNKIKELISKNTEKSKYIYKCNSADEQIKKEKNLEINYKIEIRNNTLGLYKETKMIIPYNKLDKINIISYKLTDKDFDSIKSLLNFNYSINHIFLIKKDRNMIGNYSNFFMIKSINRFCIIFNGIF